MTKWDIKALKNNPYYYVLLLVLTWDWAAVQKLWEAFQRQIFGLDLKFCRMEWKVLSYMLPIWASIVGRPGTQWSLWFTVPSSPQRSEKCILFGQSDLKKRWDIWYAGTFYLTNDFWSWSLGWLKQLSFGWLKQLFHGGRIFRRQVIEETAVWVICKQELRGPRFLLLMNQSSKSCQ